MKNDHIVALATLFSESSNCVAFTGAEFSILSRIRDFLRKEGLYTTINADKMFDSDLFFLAPSIYYNSARDFIYGLYEKKLSIMHIRGRFPYVPPVEQPFIDKMEYNEITAR